MRIKLPAGPNSTLKLALSLVLLHSQPEKTLLCVYISLVGHTASYTSCHVRNVSLTLTCSIWIYNGHFIYFYFVINIFFHVPLFYVFFFQV